MTTAWEMFFSIFMIYLSFWLEPLHNHLIGCCMLESVAQKIRHVLGKVK